MSTKVTPVSNKKDNKEVAAGLDLQQSINNSILSWGSVDEEEPAATSTNTSTSTNTNTSTSTSTAPSTRNCGAYAVYLDSSTKPQQFYIVEKGVVIGSYGTYLPGSKISVRVADQEDYLRRMFDDYDTNGDGDIDQHELKEQLEQIFLHGGVEELPLSDEEIENVLDSLDKDGNGTVDVDEWVGWLMEGIADPRTRKTMMQSEDSLHKKLGILLEVVATLCQLEMCVAYYVGDDQRYLSCRVQREKFVNVGCFCLLGGHYKTGVEQLRWVSRVPAGTGVAVIWEEKGAKGIMTAASKVAEAKFLGKRTVKRYVRNADERSAIRSKDMLIERSLQCPTIGVELVIGMEYNEDGKILCGLSPFGVIGKSQFHPGTNNSLDGIDFPAVSNQGVVVVVANKKKRKSRSKRGEDVAREKMVMKIGIGVLIFAVVVAAVLFILILIPGMPLAPPVSRADTTEVDLGA